MDYVETLAQKNREMGVVSTHVSWTNAGAALSADEKARHQLSIIWQAERGHSCVVENLDGFSMADQWRRFVAWIRRATDNVRGIKNPYL